MAVRRGGPLLPSRPRAGARLDGHRDPGARRPARGARRGGAHGGVPAPLPARGRRARGAPGRPELRPAARGGGGALPPRPGPPGGLGGEALRGIPRRRGGAQRRADPVRGQPRGAAADRHRRGPAPPDRRRASLAQAAVRRHRGLLASGVRLPPRNRAAARRARTCASSAPTRARTSPARSAGAGAGRGGAGRVHDRLGGRGAGVVARGYPSDPAYAEFHRLSMEGMRLWSIGGDPYDPRRRALAPRVTRGVRRRRGERLRAFREQRRKPGLVTFAIDTELLGHWWSEGPIWLEAVLRRSASAASGFSPSPRPWSATSRRSDRLRSRPGARARTFAPGTRPRSPISPGRRGAWSCACWPRSAPRR